MADNKPTVDLSNTKYDALETSLSQTLGLKTFLVSGWSGSGDFSQAQAELAFAKTKETWEAARDKYVAAKEAMLASLRANIAERDPSLASDLTDKDLMALKDKGHVTVRKSTTEHESAVLIFDPVSTPATSFAVLGFSDGKGGDTTMVNLTTGGSAEAQRPAQEEALAWAFDKTAFNNVWKQYDDDRNEAYIPVSSLVQNFDIDLDDIRRYQALVNIRYALRHQNEAANEMSRDLPSFVNFAGLMEMGSRGMRTGYYDKSLRDVFSDVSAIETRYKATERFGFKDPQFFEKIKLTGAIMNIVYDNLTPNNTFARLEQNDGNDKTVRDTMEDLRKRMEAKVEEKFPGAFYSGVTDDWRVLFPVFREVYEADKSTGVQREYLDTIMAGLQKYFPTITNAPIPASLSENEPPRTLPKPGPAPASGPQPGPAPAA